jgi:hypothetical protein
MSKKNSDKGVDLRRKEVHPDASGFVQNSPDARGFECGEKSPGADGKWRSNYPDANGFYHSPTSAD